MDAVPLRKQWLYVGRWLKCNVFHNHSIADATVCDGDAFFTNKNYLPDNYFYRNQLFMKLFSLGTNGRQNGTVGNPMAGATLAFRAWICTP